jgi:AcrR family transcriptional regulator
MTPDERRAAIVTATLPLLAEYGAAVTTGQIAAAAGVAEGTVFRAFADKQELLEACLQAACDHTGVTGAIREIPLTLPIRERLLRATATVAEHWDRAVSVGQAVRTSCHDPSRPGPPGAPGAAMRQVTSAVADLLAPDAAALRLSPERTARIYLLTVTSDRMLQSRMAALEGSGPGDTEELIEVFLHGALRGEHE